LLSRLDVVKPPTIAVNHEQDEIVSFLIDVRRMVANGREEDCPIHGSLPVMRK